MHDAKTKPNAADVDAYLAAIEPAQRQADARALCALMGRVSGEPPVMWGTSIVGFGTYRYRYASGHQGETCKVGFAARKAALTLYLMGVMVERPDLITRLGKVKTGKGCVHVGRLAEVDNAALEEVVSEEIAWAERTYPS